MVRGLSSITDRPTAAGGDGGSAAGDRARRQEKWAVIAFLAYLGIAPFMLVGVFGRHQWFVVDDWDFLSSRRLTSLHDLLRPHNEHWTTLPIIYYRAMWHLFGIRSFVPYQLAVVLVHLLIAWLLRVVMRRAGVGPWMATLAASILVLFGSGQQNILWSFQISFTGAIALGLGQLLLLDHDGRVDLWDVVGVVLGVGAVMTSAIGVPMVIAAGFAALLRRGWRLALLHLSPLIPYALWYAHYHPRSTTAVLGTPRLWQMIKWAVAGVVQTAHAVGYYTPVAILLTVVLVVGLILAWSPLSVARFREVAWGPSALVVGAIAFWSFNSYGRALLGTTDAAQSRYLYTSAALLLPALAVAADALVRRGGWLMVVVPLLLLIGIPPNINEFTHEDIPPAYFESVKQLVLAIPESPLAKEVPRSVRPEPSSFGLGNLTVGWLLRASADGKLPPSPKIPPGLASELRVRLGVAEDYRATPPMVCTLERGVTDVATRRGEQFRIKQAVRVTTIADGKDTSPPVEFNPGDPIAGQVLTIELRGLDLRFRPVLGPYTLCATGRGVVGHR